MLSDITFAVTPLVRVKALVLDSKPSSTFVTLRLKPDRRQRQLDVPADLERREGVKGRCATKPAS